MYKKTALKARETPVPKVGALYDSEKIITLDLILNKKIPPQNCGGIFIP